jgi:hypothetical protein
MTYNKPEITVLGDAVRVIQNPPFKSGNPVDGSNLTPITAYDLDE